MVPKCIIYCLAADGEVERLSDLARRHGWTTIQTITENPSTAPGQRSGLAEIRRMVAKGEVQALVVTSITLLGTSLDEVVGLIAKMTTAKVTLITEVEGIDTTTPKGCGWMAAVASLQGFQQALRRQKVRAGQRRAQEAGIHCGRPPIPEATMKNVRAALAAENGVRPTARKFGISPARVAIEKSAMTFE